MTTHLCREASRALASGGLEAGRPFMSIFYRVHIWYCWHCWPYRDQLAALGGAARALWGAPMAGERRASLEDRVLARLRRPS